MLVCIPTMLGASMVVFVAIHLIPGNIIQIMLGTGGHLTAGQVALLRAQYGLNHPLYVQYWDWLRNLLQGNLGVSLRTGIAVARLVRSGFGVTLELSLLSMLLAVVVAIPLGVISAARPGGLLDGVVRVLGLFGQSVPSFWLGAMLILAASSAAPALSAFTFVQFAASPVRNLEIMFLPSITLSLGLSGVLMRMTRSSVLDVVQNDYVRTARAKGLSSIAVLRRHVLRNALVPIVTVIGLQMGYVLGGAVIIENVFSLPGIGRLLVNGIYQRDYPVVEGSGLLIAVIFILINILVDISYVWIDPRIRYS